MTRWMRACAGAALALALSALVLGATSARAGTFSNPFLDTGVCGSVSISSSMNDVDVFAASAKCPSLCKAAGAQCQRYVHRVIACYVALNGTNAVFEAKNCVESNPPAAARACKATVKANLLTVRSLLANDRDTGDLGCADWESQCLSMCPL